MVRELFDGQVHDQEVHGHDQVGLLGQREPLVGGCHGRLVRRGPPGQRLEAVQRSRLQVDDRLEPRHDLAPGDAGGQPLVVVPSLDEPL